MSDSLLSIKKRLASVQSIGKMTKAMKLIATARYTKWKNLWDGNKNYEQAMREAFLLCMQHTNLSHKKDIPNCMKQNESDRKLYIFITSNLGLCGAYNHNLFKFYSEVVNPEDDVIFIGERGFKHFEEKQHKSYSNFIYLASSLNYDKVNEFRHWLDMIYKNENYKSVNVIYMSYINSLNTKPINKQILPLLKADIPPINIENQEPIIEPSASEAVNLIAPHYMDALLYRILLESNVSEQITRRNSMDNATNSADKLANELKIEFNKMRQAEITQEITEVISGANSSK